jgi:hypothetical protein
VIHVETSAPQPARWHRQSTHRTLGAAAKAAARTAGGELVAASHGVTVEAL